MAFKLITVEELKMAVKGEFDSAFNVLLEQYIDAIGEKIAEFCNRIESDGTRPNFDQKSRTVLLDVETQKQKLQLYHPPLLTSPAIQVWESRSIPRVYDSTTLLVEGEDFFVDRASGQLRRYGTYWACGPQSIKVIYTGDYVTAHGQAVPSQLKEGVRFQINALFEHRSNMGINSRSLEGGSISIVQRLILFPEVKDMVSGFKVWG